MKSAVAAISFLIPLGISVLLFPDGLTAMLIAMPLVAIAAGLISRSPGHRDFLLPLFACAFLVRAVVASFIYAYDLQVFFGSDALVHEAHGFMLFEAWNGYIPMPPVLDDWNKPWGLHVLIAGVYSLIGRNPLAISVVSCFCGAVTSVVIYLITHRIFNNSRTARLAALLGAFFPAMIIWSSQIMKDGFVVFFVVLVIYFLTKLQCAFKWADLALLLVCMVGIFSVRFYIFYFVAFACAGSFLLGGEKAVSSNLRGLIILSVIAFMLAYSGVLTIGTEQMERLTDVEAMQYSRMALSEEAQSGYGRETDITTAGGALLAFPTGLINLLFAPFPWQFTSVRAALPFPEMLVWWALIPAFILGVRYTVLNRFRAAAPMLLFTITLTVAYALFQTNVGTAYRQRTQVQVFLFVFVAAGLTIFKERREDKTQLSRYLRHGHV